MHVKYVSCLFNSFLKHWDLKPNMFSILTKTNPFVDAFDSKDAFPNFSESFKNVLIPVMSTSTTGASGLSQLRGPHSL